jgi:hypothetical protein
MDMMKTRTVALAMTGLVALGGAAACGSSSSGGSSAGGSTSTAPSTSAPAPASTPSSSPSPVLSAPMLNHGVHTQVIVDKTFYKALGKLGVKVGLIGKAKLDPKTLTLTFPITSGSATYYKPGTVTPYVQGNIYHRGSGFSLTAGGITVGLGNFDVNPGTSMLTGRVQATQNGKTTTLFKKGAPLFFLNGSTLQAPKMGPNGEVILYGTKVYLTQTAADLLTKTYKLPAGTLSSSTLIGVARITLGTM